MRKKWKKGLCTPPLLLADESQNLNQTSFTSKSHLIEKFCFIISSVTAEKYEKLELSLSHSCTITIKLYATYLQWSEGLSFNTNHTNSNAI